MRFCLHLSFLLILYLFSPYTYAADSPLPASPASSAISSSDKTTYMEAQEVEGKKDAQMEALGKVEMQQGSQKIFADHVIYEQKTGDLTANGSVSLEQGSETISGPGLKMNTTTHIGEMATPVFELKQTQILTQSQNQNQMQMLNNGRGSAASMTTTGPTFYEFDHAIFTTCPAGDDDWLLHMSRLDLDRGTQIGTAHNAWIEFEGVPFLYTPWMSFPLDGARHTGFLAPVYGSTSTGGTELTVPFYFNIAPNYDDTLAVKDMTKRGKLIENEFRFKEAADSFGEVHYDEIPNDHIAGFPRYHYSFVDTQNLGGGFRSAINVNHVSDNNYFRDLSVAMADVTQTQLTNEGVVSYGNGGFTASLKGQAFQTLQDALGDVAAPYQLMPRISLAYQKTNNDLAMSFVNEYVDFRHPTLVEGQRTVLYPSVTYFLLNDPGYYIKPKVGINYSQYEMGDHNTSNLQNATRVVPIFSLDNGMTFERDMALGQSEYVQTFEPRIYYVKIPYQNQDAIPVYDTSQATLSFAQMFSENRFYGNDRIGDANMATGGVTTRLIDSEGGIERLHIGVAERYNFTMPQVNLVTPDVSPKSDILVSVGGKATKSITLDSLIDYNPNAKFTTAASANLTYKPELGKLLNLGYHFSDDLVTPTNNVRQADLSGQWPIYWHWSAVTRVSYDLQNQLLSERLLGLEYNQSCWTFRLITEVFTTSVSTSTYGLYIQLELNELVAVGNNPITELKTNIPGYIQLNDPKLKTSPANTPGQIMP